MWQIVSSPHDPIAEWWTAVMLFVDGLQIAFVDWSTIGQRAPRTGLACDPCALHVTWGSPSSPFEVFMIARAGITLNSPTLAQRMTSDNKKNPCVSKVSQDSYYGTKLISVHGCLAHFLLGHL